MVTIIKSMEMKLCSILAVYLKLNEVLHFNVAIEFYRQERLDFLQILYIFNASINFIIIHDKNTNVLTYICFESLKYKLNSC